MRSWLRVKARILDVDLSQPGYKHFNSKLRHNHSSERQLAGLALTLAQLSFSLTAVVCSFRGSVSQGLVLDLGETVHILEKCEGKD